MDQEWHPAALIFSNQEDLLLLKIPRSRNSPLGTCLLNFSYRFFPVDQPDTHQD